MKLFIVFLVTMLISFVGSLPLGPLNIATLQISVTDGYSAASWFTGGYILIEIIYARISLVAMDKFRKQKRFLEILSWLAFFITVALAIASLIPLVNKNTHTGNILLSNALPRFYLGLFLGAISPAQIPFWFGCSAILFSNKILLPRNDHYNMYLFGIGLGSVIASALFIFWGQLIANRFNANQTILHWVIGGSFLIVAAIQLWRLLKREVPK